MADAAGVLRAIERAVAHSIRPDAKVAVAWSGGLASTLVATVARKRTEIACYAVRQIGSDGMRDIQVEARVLDFPIEVIDGIPPTSRAAIDLVRRRASEAIVLTGESHGTDLRRGRGITRPLLDAAVRRTTHGRRPALAAAARLAGIPDRIVTSDRKRLGPSRRDGSPGNQGG